MNLPNSEQFPDDSDRLPPARRRRARRLLAPVEVDERTALIDRLAHQTSPSFDFYLFSLFAGLVISLGVFFDEPSVILLGALLAPVMTPVIGLSLGTVTGSFKVFFRSLLGLLVSSILVFAVGLVVGIFSSFWNLNGFTQASLFDQVSWPNFIVMVTGAILMTASMVNSDRKPLIPSVAVAYELFVPLTIAGFGLGSGIPHFWPDGLVIFVVYLSWAALFGAFSFALLGLRPMTIFGYTLGGAIILVCVILLFVLSGTGAVFGAQIALPTPVPTATYTITPVPPTLTSTLTPVPPTETLTPTLTPTSTTPPTVTLTPTPTPVFAYINASTGNPPGAKIRSEPNGTVIRSYLNDTLVQVLPETQEVDDLVWVHVIVVSDGTNGWILQSLLLVATPAPGW